MTLLERERDKYRRMWECWQYRERSPGERLVPLFLKNAEYKKNQSLIDVGCGTGRAARELSNAGFLVTCFDIAENALEMGNFPFIDGCLWDIPAEFFHFDWFYCCDVMEHIPTEYVDKSLDNLQAMAERGFFQIALHHDGWGDLIGESLHLTVESTVWWLKKLTARWAVTIFPEWDPQKLVCLVGGKDADRSRSRQ